MATIFPTVHLNGTSADDLQQRYENAYRAINDAITVLQQTAPHGRDYYVQSSDAISHATAEHEARMYALMTVRDDMLMLYDAVGRQKKPTV